MRIGIRLLITTALVVTVFTPAYPQPDNCGDAEVPVPVPSVTAGTTTGATFDDAGECETSNTAPGVWYRVIGTGNMMTASTCNDGDPATGSANYDSKISVYCEDCDVLTCVAGNDDYYGCASYSSSVSWCSQEGAEYLILVHGYDTATGDFELAIDDVGAACLCETVVECGGAQPEPPTLLFSEPRIISTAYAGHWSIYAADFDNDGDTDILTCDPYPLLSAQPLKWHENLDGLGHFEAHPLGFGGGGGLGGGPDYDVHACSSPFAADLDGDEDTDLLAAWLVRPWSPEDPYWGEEGWGAEVGSFACGEGGCSVPLSFYGHPWDWLWEVLPWTVVAADVDGDGDNDAIFSTSFLGGIWWSENTGSGAIGEPPVFIGGGESILPADVDGDGDTDVLSALYPWNNTIAWYENLNGLGNFGPLRVIDPHGASPLIFPTDMDGDGNADWPDIDGDGDVDVVTGRGWYENVDGLGEFGPLRVVDPQGSRRTVVADMDGDGNMDIMTERGWYENLDGLGNFRGQPIGTCGAFWHFPADVDGDGDTDVLASIPQLVWYENLSVFVDIDIKPGSDTNPFNPRSNGVTPVALLGSEDFDVADVDVTTLAFGPWEAAPRHDLTDEWTYTDHLEDVNLDGFMDLVMHYPTQETGILCGDDEGTLTGQLLDGRPFQGTDEIRTVGCPPPERAQPAQEPETVDTAPATESSVFGRDE